MSMTDKTLMCRDCGKEFAFTTGEQEFYSSRGLVNEPKRCPECRATRRREQQQQGGGFGNRPSFSATCAECGTETTVPFEPTEGRPVYCRDCYTKVRQQSEARS